MKIKTLLLLVLVGSFMLTTPFVGQAQEPENEINLDFNPEMFKMKKSTSRTGITAYWGFGPTFVTSNVEENGVYYPEFKPFSSWSNDLGVMWHTRLGGQESKFNLFYGLLCLYINIETKEGRLELDADDQPVYSEIVDVKNTELNIHTLSIPLLFEYKSKFSVAAGGFLAYRIGSSSEVDGKVNGNRYDTKLRADFGLNDLLYGVTAQIGAKRVRLYANYYLNNLFKEDSPYDFTVMNIGIAFM